MADLTPEEWMRQAQEVAAGRVPSPQPELTVPPVTPPDAEAERRRLRFEAATPEEREWTNKLEKQLLAQGQGSALVPPSPFRSLSNRAVEAGIGTRGVSSAARLNMGLAFGQISDPREQLELVRRAIENDTKKPVEVRIGPLDEVEWRFRGEQQWDLVNGAGFGSFLRDVAGSVPEIAVTAAGVAGGVGGAVAGSRIPFRGMAVTGDIGGAGLSEAVAEYFRLDMARRQGLIDWPEERIQLAALTRGGMAGAGTGATIAGIAAFRRVVDWVRGSPSLATDVFITDPRGRPVTGPTVGSSIEQGMLPAEDLARRVQALTGQDFSMTSGQVAAMPTVATTQAGRTVQPEMLPPGASEALLGQEAARRMGQAGQPVRDILSSQAQALEAADFAVFAANDPSARVRAGRAIQGAMNALLYRRRTRSEAEVTRLRNEAIESGNRVDLMAHALGPDLSTAELANISRDALTAARADVFQPFGEAYNRLQNQTGFEINLGPFRDSAADIERRWGQGILDTISIRGQDNLVDEARRAGLEVVGIIDGVRIIRDNPASLGQVMQTIEDLNEQLRRPTIQNLPRAEAIFRVLRDGLLDAVERSAGPETRAQIDAVRQAYSRSIQQFDTGIVGAFLERDRFDRYVISGDDATNTLLRDPSASRAFVEALFTRQEIDPATGARMTTNLPDGPVALRAAQDAVLSRVLRDFRDYQTGQWNMPGLSAFLQANQEALEMLFVRGPRLASEAFPGLEAFRDRSFPFEQLNAVRSWTAAADRMQQRQTAALKLFSDRFGVYTHDPAVMVQTLITEGRVADLRLAERIVNRVYGQEGVASFRSGLASQARNLMTGADGILTPQKIDAFMQNESGRTVAAMLGPSFGQNLLTLRDMLRVMELRGTGGATDIARQFGYGVPQLRGMLRYLRVLFPPLSPSGRGLTATVGLANEQTQRQIGSLLAEPQRLAQFIRAAETVRDPFSAAARTQLVRIGFGHIPAMWDALRNTYGAATDALLDEEPVPGSHALPGERPTP